MPQPVPARTGNRTSQPGVRHGKAYQSHALEGLVAKVVCCQTGLMPSRLDLDTDPSEGKFFSLGLFMVSHFTPVYSPLTSFSIFILLSPERRKRKDEKEVAKEKEGSRAKRAIL